MQQNRPKLTLKLSNEKQGPGSDAVAILSQAIRNHLCVRGSYNRGLIILAPYILFERHCEAFVDGVALERNGSPPSEIKLGRFKLRGLHDLVRISEAIRYMEHFDPTSPDYAEKILAAIDF